MVNRREREFILDCIKTISDKYNFNYTISGDDSIAPIKVFDDGVFTYFEFKDKNGNPWDDRHRFSAPESIVASITEKMQQNQLNPYPERLIA